MEATITSSWRKWCLKWRATTFTDSLSERYLVFGGADAASFELDKNGNITSKDIMNFEDKASVQLLPECILMGDKVYTETIVLNVVNNVVDDNTHIANVNYWHSSRALKMQ